MAVETASPGMVSKTKSPVPYLGTPGDRRWLLALLLVALVTRAGLIALLPIGSEAEIAARSGDEKYYLQIAHAIVEDGRFVERNLLAYRPPLYPGLLALNLAAFGGHVVSVQILQNLLFVASMFALVLLVWGRAGRRAGLLAGGLLLASPLWITLPQTAYAETLFMALIAAGLVLLDRIDRGAGGCGSAAVLGLVMGLAALTREVALPMAVLALAASGWLAWRRRGTCRVLGPPVVAGLLTGATIATWTARNYVGFHSFVPISTNAPVNLYIGNNPEATGDFHWALPAGAERLWNTPSDHGRNEVEAARLALDGALAYMHDHPGRTLMLAGRKMLHFWVTPPVGHQSVLSLGGIARFGRSGFELVLTGFGLCGLWMLRRTAIGWAIFLGTASASVAHALTFFNLRFRAPFDALLAVPAAIAVAALLRQSQRIPSGGSQPAPARVTAAATCGEDVAPPVPSRAGRG